MPLFRDAKQTFWTKHLMRIYNERNLVVGEEGKKKNPCPLKTSRKKSFLDEPEIRPRPFGPVPWSQPHPSLRFRSPRYARPLPCATRYVHCRPEKGFLSVRGAIVSVGFLPF